MAKNPPIKEELLKKWSESIKVLANKTRLAIVITLYGSEFFYKKSPSLQFSKLREIVKVSSTKTLVYHLKVLCESELVQKVAYQDEEGRVHALYQITQKGMEFLRDFGLLEGIRTYVISPRTCPKCGRKVQPDFRFCPYCGKSLEFYLLSE